MSKFIVFEGIDKSGKTTQTELLFSFLVRNKIDCLKTVSPSKLWLGEKIRDCLRGKFSCSPQLLRLFFVADKMFCEEQIIAPALSEKKIVISDRWIHSTLAYGQADGFYLGWLLEINKYVRKPDLVIYLKIDPEESMVRLKREGGVPEKYEKIELLGKVANKYEWLLKNKIFCDNYLIVDGKQGIADISEQVRRGINEMFHLWGENQS